MNNMRIAHIINPVKVKENSDLYTAQPVTFRTMVKAKEESKYSNHINQYVIGYEEDESIFPKKAIALDFLNKSVLDYGDFEKTRKLPLIADILTPLKDFDVDYVVYTNVDIAIMPYFYDYIYEKIEKGSDSLIINRRVLKELASDACMYSEIGDSHPGYDCFVFRKELIQKFKLGAVCIGANWIGRIMYSNLIVFSNKLEIIKDAHLTFHIGDDGLWLQNDYSEFDAHNKKEVYQQIGELIELNLDDLKTKSLNNVIAFMDSWSVEKENINIKTVKNISFIKRVKNKMKTIVIKLLE